MTTPLPSGDGPLVPSRRGPIISARLFRLARKEVTEILRDRRTIVTLVVMPLLLYPLLTIGFGLYHADGRMAEAVPIYRVGFVKKDQERLESYLSLGVGIKRPDQPDLRAGPVDADDIDGAVREGLFDVGFRPPPADELPRRAHEWDLVYREDSTNAREAIRYLEQVAASADAGQLRTELRNSGLRPPPALRFVAVPLAVERPTGLSIAVFVPLVLILMTMTGAVYPAIDLTAGERERGTLELLIAAPVPRVSLLLAKYVAVVTVAVLTALVNLGSMTASLLIGGMGARVFGPGGIRLVTLVEILGLVLLFAAFFSAVLLVVTSFARSFKEAQAYLIPLMVVALVPGIVGLLPGLHLSGPLAVVPLLNIVLLARDLLAGHAEGLSAAVVVISTAAYALLAVAVAARVFGAEGVLYGDSGGWRMLLRGRR